MFSSLGLFKEINCPEQPHCSLTGCIFAHPVLATLQTDAEDDIKHTTSRKRQRLNEDGDSLDMPAPISRLRSPVTKVDNATAKFPTASVTTSREISPPPLRDEAKVKVKGPTPAPKCSPEHQNLPSTLRATSPADTASPVSLNPKMIPHPPAAHAIRMQLITLIYEQMLRLNEEAQQDREHPEPALLLSGQELILEALKEEENVAKQSPAVYLNVIKLRIVKLKKMKLADWKKERFKRIADCAPVDMQVKLKGKSKSIETGLSSSEEVAFLSRILAKQEPLAKYGYVPKTPTEEEVAKAREGVEAAQAWEICDRCKTRFQVFQGRREEDGALTSGGQCSYHPAKPRRPQQRDKADRSNKEPFFACCNESVGESPGCTKAGSHVFKVSDPKRLSLSMPFKVTPPKVITPGPDRAVCFDCEMGYTTIGLELIRLTAVSWPNGEELLDVLVRPLGEILDLNSRFSGVFPDDYANAIPRGGDNTDCEGEEKRQSSKPRLQLAESPFVARDLLFELITPETPLIGHALDNDLNATRIIHPSLVDSVLLYPHPRGLPLRHGLKALMKTHLDRDIQMGGVDGHDSKEDARAAGDLARLKVADMWKAMKRDGRS